MNNQTYIYPTDTVWGIGGSIFSEASYLEIARIKQTDDKKPLSILFSSMEEFYEYVQLPTFLTKEWLQLFFSMETSLLVPLEWMKKEIPFFIYQGSEFVSLRVLEFPFLKIMTRELSGPLTTTSLNLTGQLPIVDYNEAKKFHEEYAPHLIFAAGNKEKLSGRSSTMMKVGADLNFSVLREGGKIKDVLQHCRLSST